MLLTPGQSVATGYSHRSNNIVNFQPVPSVAHLHYPPSPQTASRRQYSIESSSGEKSRQFLPMSSSYQYSSTGSNNISPGNYASASSPYSSSLRQPQYQRTSQQSYSSSSNNPQPAPLVHEYSSPSVSSAPSYYSNGGDQSQYSQQSSLGSSSSSSTNNYNRYSSVPSNNVQVAYGAPPNLPPGASYGPPPRVTGAGPDHNVEYRVVYVKGPKAPAPDVVLPPPPPKQKTIVYILVPRFQPADPIIIPTLPPTPPPRPEVYFIRYKAPKKERKVSNNLLKTSVSNILSSGEYGAPSGEYNTPSVVEAPDTVSKRTGNSMVTVSSSMVTSSSEVNSQEVPYSSKSEEQSL